MVYKVAGIVAKKALASYFTIYADPSQALLAYSAHAVVMWDKRYERLIRISPSHLGYVLSDRLCHEDYYHTTEMWGYHVRWEGNNHTFTQFEDEEVLIPLDDLEALTADQIKAEALKK